MGLHISPTCLQVSETPCNVLNALVLPYHIYLSIMHKIFYHNKNSKSGCALYMSESQEKGKQNFILIFNQKLGVCFIHECALYSNKYGRFFLIQQTFVC